MTAMESTDEAIVLAFNDAINARDLLALGGLMDDEHRFVDSTGATTIGKPACLDAWRSFFDAFSDYRNVFDEVRSTTPGVVEVRGRSVCSEPTLAGPARWRAVVKDGRVLVWQVSDGG